MVTATWRVLPLGLVYAPAIWTCALGTILTRGTADFGRRSHHPVEEPMG